MGTQFSIIYDVITVALVVGFLFAGAKKGLAGVLVGLVASVVAFFCAATFNAPIAEYFYGTIVEQPLEEAVDSAMDSAMDEITLVQLGDLDYSSIMVNGTPVGEITPEYSGTSKTVMDLSSVDLSKTGIDELDLTAFGMKDMDYSSVNAKTAEFSMHDIAEYGLGEVIVAHIISMQVQHTQLFTQITDYTDVVGDTLPILFGGTAEAIRDGSEDAIMSLVLNMQQSGSTVKQAVIGSVIEPAFMVAAKTILFVLIFAIIAGVLGFVSTHLSFLNDIPIVGGVNYIGGALAGAVEGIIGVFAVCIVLRFIIQLSGGEVMFINDIVIEETMLFKYVYNIDILNFLK